VLALALAEWVEGNKGLWSHARQYSWVTIANNLSGWQIILKKSKLKMDTSLNKAQYKQELLYG
jgi:hypothetical protein